MTFVDVILPLPVEGTFTYSLPPELEGRVRVGFRVIVPFGTAKLYSGIVTSVRENVSSEQGVPATHGRETPSPVPAPHKEVGSGSSDRAKTTSDLFQKDSEEIQKDSDLVFKKLGQIKIKPVVDILEDHPILTEAQLQFWKWLSFYYMCPLGDVYKAALPSGLKLASETSVHVDETFDAWNQLTAKEMSVLKLLQENKATTVQQLHKQLKDNRVLSYVRSMMAKGALTVKETIDSSFRPKKEVYVRLPKKFLSNEALKNLLSGLQRTPKRERLLNAYIEMAGVKAALQLKNLKLLKEVSRRELLDRTGISAAVLLALKSKGILELYENKVDRLGKTGVQIVEQLPLSRAQQDAFDSIKKQFREKQICLLHGVTSSGKTEIYIRLIKEAMEAGKQVLYLVPEIALTTQLTTRLRRIFGDDMVVYHSRFPDAQRVEIWLKQLSSSPYKLVLGARSALFLPYRRLGLVIVDEEHETSYKQTEPAPRYNARDAAMVLAAQNGARTLLGTATPSLEAYWNAQKGKYGLVELTSRFGDVLMPQIEIVDVKELMRTKQMKLPFSPRLEEEIEAALKRKEQVILFQNRRGYSPVVECPTCGWVPMCPTCDVSLTFHYDQHRMVCHYCGKTFELPQACPQCGETHLRSYGFGTEKIEEEVHKRFPTARTARLDLDSTRSRTAYERIIGDFDAGRTDILIGTQMVTKGLDFGGVHVVGILDADTMLTRPDFRCFERAFQMMSQVAGRAGRHSERGYVILQTKHADYPIVRQVQENDYRTMYKEQMEERRMFHYPPFYRLVYIFVKHPDYQTAEHAAQALGEALRRRFAERVLGPDKPAVSRIQKMHIRKLAVKIERQSSPSAVRRLMREAVDETRHALSVSNLQIYFDVDPL